MSSAFFPRPVPVSYVDNGNQRPGTWRPASYYNPAAVAVRFADDWHRNAERNFDARYTPHAEEPDALDLFAEFNAANRLLVLAEAGRWSAVAHLLAAGHLTDWSQVADLDNDLDASTACDRFMDWVSDQHWMHQHNPNVGLTAEESESLLGQAEDLLMRARVAAEHADDDTDQDDDQDTTPTAPTHTKEGTR